MNLEEFYRTLASTRDAAKAIEKIDRVARASQWVDLIELVGGLEDQVTIPHALVREVSRHVVTRLAEAPSLESILSARNVIGANTGLSGHSRTTAQRRALASRLGYWKKRPALLGSIIYHNSIAPQTELLACWIQDHVLRRDDLQNSRLVRDFWQQLQRESHALAWLPTRRLRSEKRFSDVLPQYDDHGGWSRMSGFGPDEHGPDKPVRDLSLRPVLNARDPGNGTSGALENWSTRRRECRAFALDNRDQRTTHPAEFLLSLGLQCLERASVGDLRLQELSCAGSVHELFSAAAGGGAYGGGLGAAYGRLRAWQSVAGFVDAQNLSIDDLEARAKTYTWISFNAKTGWFYQAAWDFGLVAIDAAQENVCVLACSDTD